MTMTMQTFVRGSSKLLCSQTPSRNHFGYAFTFTTQLVRIELMCTLELAQHVLRPRLFHFYFKTYIIPQDTRACHIFTNIPACSRALFYSSQSLGKLRRYYSHWLMFRCWNILLNFLLKMVLRRFGYSAYGMLRKLKNTFQNRSGPPLFQSSASTHLNALHRYLSLYDCFTIPLLFAYLFSI